jgi:NADH:ubiquinone oxidoreductase subunit C
MKSLETLREELGTAEPWVESRGTWWLNPGTVSVRHAARVMNEMHARFITITAYQLPGAEGFRLEYHWDLHGRLLGLPFTIAGNAPEGAKIDSIFDLCEAADWIEREVHEEYSIDFTGRVYEPLLLRKGDKTGVNLREDPNAPPKPAAAAPGPKEVAQ